jgi:carbon storage regulator
MLVLSRQKDESIMIGDDVKITIVDVRGDKVRLGITAPKEIPVHRIEVYEAIQREKMICFLSSAALFATVPPKHPSLRLRTPMHFNIEILNAPYQGLFVGMEKYVEPVSADGAAPVEDFYRLSIFVAGDEHFGAERVLFVSRHEGIARPYFVAAGRYAVCIFAAAFFARAIGSYTHSHGSPFAGLFRPGFYFRFIQSGSADGVRLGDSSAE